MFSTFPGGSRGIGLLLLRSAVGMAAIVRGAADVGLSAHLAAGPPVMDVLAVFSGASLLVGLLTPVAGGLVALGAMSSAFSWFSLPAANQPEIGLMTMFVAVVAATVILLGPGAFSLDARLFGRREIIIPGASHSPHSTKF